MAKSPDVKGMITGLRGRDVRKSPHEASAVRGDVVSGKPEEAESKEKKSDADQEG